MSETELKREIVQKLEKCGFWVERIQSGKVKVRGGWMYLASEGTPDLHLVDLGAWLEVKTDDGEPSPEQVDWHKRAAAAGVRVATVRTPKEAIQAALDWKLER
jgi:hypothetical protein